MRVTLVHNPGAGDERHSAKRIMRELEEAGYDARLESIKKQDLGEALEDPGDLVVVAGGDGSIKKVAIAMAGRGVPLAILPIGTANNIAKSLGALGSIRELIEGWRRAERRRLAVGTVTTRWGAMRFVESVGVGVFTELVTRGDTEVNESSTGLTGHAIDRALLLLQRIVAERVPRLRQLEIDGSDFSGEYLLVEVMNMPLVGPNIPLAPGADYGDEQLEVVTVGEHEREVLAEYVQARLSGGAAPPKLTGRRGTRVKFRASPAELHVDDAAWRPDPHPDDEPPGPGLEEGEVAVALDSAVEVLIAPPNGKAAQAGAM
ncbi:diacylglycerol kinase family lipid kinase [soil metagenome]